MNLLQSEFRSHLLKGQIPNTFTEILLDSHGVYLPATNRLELYINLEAKGELGFNLSFEHKAIVELLTLKLPTFVDCIKAIEIMKPGLFIEVLRICEKLELLRLIEAKFDRVVLADELFENIDNPGPFEQEFR